MSQTDLPPLPDTEFWRAWQGRFQGILTWEAFDALWKVIRSAIEPGGRFAGQFFGERDTWASIPDRSHHTRLRVEKLLLGLDVEYFKEDESDSVDAEGQDKHWHVFHVVARQPE